MINNLVNKLPSNVMNELPLIIEKFAIDNPLRLAHFLAQCAHESADFKVVLENLNYGARGLLLTFPKYFNAEDALLHERKPQEIANIVYANRMGNTAAGDGWKYRGRGYIQLTGRSVYKATGKEVGVDFESNPELVLNPDGATAALAGYLFMTRGGKQKTLEALNNFTDFNSALKSADSNSLAGRLVAIMWL